MDWKQMSQTDSGIDWNQAAHVYENIIACEDETSQVKATLELARLSKDAPEPVLAGIVPILVDLLDSSHFMIQAAATYALCRLARRPDGNLCPRIGQFGAIPPIIRLLPESNDCIQRTLLKCLSAVVAFDSPNRVILARNGGLEIILDLLSACADDMKQYLLEILSALAMLREVRRIIINLGGLPFLLEAVSSGKLSSRTRAAQAIGLLGVARRVRHMLVDLGVIPALIQLLRDGDASSKLIAGNALGIISSHFDYLRPVVQAGAIPLYVEMLKGPEPLGKEITEDVFCILAVAEDNAVLILDELVRILRGNEEEAKSAAVDVLWDLSGYKHSISVVKESGAIPILIELLQNGNNDIREKAAGTIAQLSYEGVNMEAMAEAGVIPVLIDLLRGDSEELREYAGEALINFAEVPLYHERVSEAFDIPSFLVIQDRLNRIRASDEHMVRSMRLMSAEQFTSDPELI